MMHFTVNASIWQVEKESANTTKYIWKIPAPGFGYVYSMVQYIVQYSCMEDMIDGY